MLKLNNAVSKKRDRETERVRDHCKNKLLFVQEHHVSCMYIVVLTEDLIDKT
jgi:hypothetical protein